MGGMQCEHALGMKNDYESAMSDLAPWGKKTTTKIQNDCMHVKYYNKERLHAHGLLRINV